MGTACSVDSIDVPRRQKTTIESGSAAASTLVVKTSKEFTQRYENKEARSKGVTLVPVRDKMTNGEYMCRRIDRKSAPCQDSGVISAHLRNLNSLDHPHLCKFVEAFEDPENWYLIYEKAEVATLFRHIQDGESFCEEDAAEYTRQVAQTLAVSHEQGIVHGRLSPSKILIAPMDHVDEGSDEEDELPAQVKICDHGQGMLLREGPFKQLSRSQTGGGPEPRRELVECMAPEVAWDEVAGPEGTKAQKMDIWSLGCIVYHMLTGVQPHRAPSMDALVDRVKSNSVEFCEDWDELSTEAREVTERMLMVNSGLRPSAATLLRHPWLRLRRESVPKKRMMRLMRNIRQNVHEGHFKRMVMRIITQQLPAESREIANIERAYRFFDRNGDGVLGVDEISAGIRKMEIFSEEELADIDKELTQLDRDGSNSVNLQEFVAGCMDAKRAFSAENLWHAFNAFDVDSNGQVSVDEVEEIVRKVEAGLLGTEQVDGLVRRVRRELEAVTKGGDIDFDQFVYIASAPTGSPDRNLALQRDVYKVANTCLGIDCYKVRRLEPKPWNWQQASRSSGSAYRRASLIVPGRRAQAGSFDNDMPASSSPAEKRSDRGKQPKQSRASKKGDSD